MNCYLGSEGRVSQGSSKVRIHSASLGSTRASATILANQALCGKTSKAHHLRLSAWKTQREKELTFGGKTTAPELL